MSDRAVGAEGHGAGGIAIAHVLDGARVMVTGAFLAFGIWSALPVLTQVGLPTPFALPTALALPRPAGAATESAATVQAALSAAQQGRRSVAVSVALTDQDLTRAAAPYFPQTYAGVTVAAPSVRVTSGRMVLTATARSFLGSGPFVASATPFASDGRLLVRVDSVTLGGMALPDAMRAQVAQQLQAAIDASTGSRLQVSSVSASEGVLTLKGTALP